MTDAPTPDGTPDGTPEALIVAIDGPAGAGKSTIARAVAATLDVPYLDTGAMFRSVTWAVLDAAVDVADHAAVGALARSMDCTITHDVVTVNGTDVSQAIRTADVTELVSAVSAIPEVRDILRDRQREWAYSAGGGVMEGRDIGTVVFPDATVKVFLTASLEERARRRAEQTGADLAEVAADMAARDHADSTREVAPLTRAADAHEVDSTHMSVDEVAAAIAQLASDAQA